LWQSIEQCFLKTSNQRSVVFIKLPEATQLVENSNFLN